MIGSVLGYDILTCVGMHLIQCAWVCYLRLVNHVPLARVVACMHMYPDGCDNERVPDLWRIVKLLVINAD